MRGVFKARFVHRDENRTRQLSDLGPLLDFVEDQQNRIISGRNLQPLIFRLMTRITEEVKDFLWLS
jgi:hypothetical protein